MQLMSIGRSNRVAQERPEAESLVWWMRTPGSTRPPATSTG